MRYRKLFLFSFLSIFFTSVVFAGSTYSYDIDSNSDWNSGTNVANTTVENSWLTTPQNFVRFTDSDFTSFQSNSNWDVYSANITQASSSSVKNDGNFGSSTYNDDYVGGIFNNMLIGEQDTYFYDGGSDGFAGDSAKYDVPSEGVYDGWAYEYDLDTTVEKTVTCDGNEHTFEWGQVDSSTAYIKIDGVQTDINEDEFYTPDIPSDCAGFIDNNVITPRYIFDGTVHWQVGQNQDDIAVGDDNGVVRFLTEPIDHNMYAPGFPASGNVSLPVTDIDTVTMFKPGQTLEGQAGIAVDGDGSDDSTVFTYEVREGSADNECSFSNALVEDSKHTLASLKGNYNFGDESNDLISVNSNNNFELLDPRSNLGGDDCNRKSLSNPTSGDLTGVASDIRDVDDDGNTELVFTVAENGGTFHNANGFIFHADFSTSGLTDVVNTSIATHEGDVGKLSDWDADNVAEIPFRDTNGDIKIADFSSSPEDSGDYTGSSQSSNKVFEGSNFTINYVADSNADSYTYTWQERGFDNSFPLSQGQVQNTNLAEDVMYSSVTWNFDFSGASDVSSKLSISSWELWGNRFKRKAEWRSADIDVSENDSTPDSMGSWAVASGFDSVFYDPKTENTDSFDNHKINFYVSSRKSDGSWSSYYDANTSLGSVPYGDRFRVKVEILNQQDSSTPKLGNTSRADSFNLDYVYPNVPVEINSFNESKDVSYVQAGENLVVETRIYDSDGGSDIVEPIVQVDFPSGLSKNLTSGDLISSSDGYLYEFNSSYDPSSGSDLGSGTLTVFGQDGNDVTNQTGFEVKDTRKPSYRNLAEESSSIEETKNNTLSVEVKDQVVVEKVDFYVDNGTGFSKVSSKDTSIGSSFTEVSYDYDTTGLEGETVDWKAEAIDSEGNTRVTEVSSFDVVGVQLIDNVTLDYRNIGGSLDKELRLDLDPDYSISDRNSVSGADTIEFNNDTWRLENFSIPFKSDLNVSSFEGINSRKVADFDVSVKNVRGHPFNSNVSYQEKNKTINVDNSGDSVYVNASCVNNGFGDPVESSVDSVFQVLGSTNESYACRWSGDWISASYKDADPTVSSVDIDGTLDVGRDVYLENNQSVKFPVVNVSGFAEPDETCWVSDNSGISVPGNGNNTESVGFGCDIGDSGSPSTNIDGSDYNHTTVLNVSSDLAENISIYWEESKSDIADWSSKDEGSAVAYVKGTSDSILLAESSDNVQVRVPDDAFSSSLHEGQTQASITYTVDASSGGTGGAGGGGGSETPRIIRNVTGKYNWSVSAPRSSGQTFYNIVGWGGRDLGNAPTRIVVRNLGDGNFSVEARCVSEDNSCDFIELSENNITLDELENDRQVVQVEGVIPEDLPEEGYRFNIVFEDPEGQEVEANFRIRKNFAQSLIIRFISKVFGVEEVDFDGEGGGEPVPVPLAFPVFLITGFFWGSLSLFIRFAQSNNMLEEGMDFTRGRLIASVFVFILSFIFI